MVILGILVTLLAAAIAVAAVHSGGAESRGTVRLFWAVAILVSFGRVGALWVLLVLEWTGRQTLAAVPLVLLLYPEGLLLGPVGAWTVRKALAFSAVLLAGSLAWAGVITALVVASAGLRRR